MSRPVLWHIPISHYSEKARWALDRKRVEFELRAPSPPAHMAVALWLTRGGQVTFPILDMDGRRAGGSAAIVALLDELRPGEDLIPSDPPERYEALEIERFFDAEVGPAARLLSWHHASSEEGGLDSFAKRSLPGPLRGSGLAVRGAADFTRVFVRTRYRVADPAAAQDAERKLEAAFDLIEGKLVSGGGEFLVGDRFSVADLTAASLLYPLVRPEGAPRGPDVPAGVERVRDRMRERPAWAWVERMFAEQR
ncbi:glutathione S-transferase family protein [Thermoleophilia bacterium SCSIO 60948]|nr:glutathione S-transferase family protein [Thermoleophilia bacterium SCSIO 60948]